MASTLTYGRVRPDNGDKGSTFWDALRDNITLDDAHDHDGVNSASLSTTSFSKGTTAVTNSGWTGSGAMYRKSVAVAAGYTFGTANMRFYLNGGTYDGEEIFPTTEKIDSSNFYLYMPVNNQAVDVRFT